MVIRLFWCERCENLRALTEERVTYLKEHFGQIDCGHYKSMAVNCGGIMKEVTISTVFDTMNILMVNE
jgi:hypothetical protein